MHAIQLLCKPRLVALLLVLHLRLGTSRAQEDREDVISVIPEVIGLGRADEYLIKPAVRNNKDKCMVVTVGTEANPTFEYAYAPLSYTACVCDNTNFYWEIIANNETSYITVKAEVVSEDGICPDDEELYPEFGFQVSRTIPIA